MRHILEEGFRPEDSTFLDNLVVYKRRDGFLLAKLYIMVRATGNYGESFGNLKRHISCKVIVTNWKSIVYRLFTGYWKFRIRATNSKWMIPSIIVEREIMRMDKSLYEVARMFRKDEKDQTPEERELTERLINLFLEAYNYTRTAIRFEEEYFIIKFDDCQYYLSRIRNGFLSYAAVPFQAYRMRLESVMSEYSNIERAYKHVHPTILPLYDVCNTTKKLLNLFDPELFPEMAEDHTPYYDLERPKREIERKERKKAIDKAIEEFKRKKWDKRWWKKNTRRKVNADTLKKMHRHYEYDENFFETDNRALIKQVIRESEKQEPVWTKIHGTKPV